MRTIQKRKIILGGGIAGLIKAYFNPEAIIISDQIGGQFFSNFQLGPKFIHVDDYSIRFFKELDIDLSTKKIKIGFYYNGSLYSENTEENRKKYFEKTRDKSGELYKSAMSANKTEFDSFSIDIKDIINAIKEKINNEKILERAIKIDLKNKKVITDKREIEYEELISTIPLNIFLFLCNKADIAKQFKSHPTTFILNSSMSSCPFKEFKDFDYVYISEQKYLYHRITNTNKGTVFEYKGDDIPIMKNEVDRVIMKVGQLVQNDIKIEIEDVEFFGRYASWNHSLLVNSLLEKIYDEIDYKNNIYD